MYKFSIIVNTTLKQETEVRLLWQTRIKIIRMTKRIIQTKIQTKITTTIITWKINSYVL